MDKDSKNTGFEWLDDAFDDEKTQAELNRAKQANNRGCLIALVVFAVAVIVAAVVGISMLGSLF